MKIVAKSRKRQAEEEAESSFSSLSKILERYSEVKILKNTLSAYFDTVSKSQYDLIKIRYGSNILAETVRGIVVSLDKKYAAKIDCNNSFNQLAIEAKRMKYANNINDLMVKFVDLKSDKHGINLLIMERLYPLQYRALDMKTRIAFLDSFENKLRELHSNGFVFRDLNATKKVPPNGGEELHNFILTKSGIRLVDTGISCLSEEVESEEFNKYVFEDLKEIPYVRNIIGLVYFQKLII